MNSALVRSRAILLAGALFLVLPAAALRAEPAHGLPSAPLLASQSGGWRFYWTRFEDFVHNSFRSRERLIQISAVAVAFGLFIMYRARRT
jgi:hypothetical protein